jgi:hypothetical protein
MLNTKCAVCTILKVEKCGRAAESTDSILRCMLFECWITKAVNTHSEFVKSFRFPLQHWLHYTYIVALYYISDL